jgi:hypothetical protein
MMNVPNDEKIAPTEASYRVARRAGRGMKKEMPMRYKNQCECGKAKARENQCVCGKAKAKENQCVCGKAKARELQAHSLSRSRTVFLIRSEQK